MPDDKEESVSCWRAKSDGCVVLVSCSIGSDKGPDQDSYKVTDKGSDESPDQDSNKVADKGTDKGKRCSRCVAARVLLSFGSEES